MDELQITVGHGAIDYLELNVSSTSITADDRAYINTTRVDVRGNRLTVVLPADNWTKTSDGQLTPGVCHMGPGEDRFQDSRSTVRDRIDASCH